MTNLERKQADFQTLNDAYAILRRSGASFDLLLQLLEAVNAAHAIYTVELHQAMADAAAGKEVTA